MNKIQNFRDLRVWQVAKLLVTEIYEITRNFPKHEIFGLAQQIQRAAVSVPSNIAEGHARGSRKEYTQFLIIARGSLAEVETQLEIAVDLGYIAQDSLTEIIEKIDYLGRMMNKLLVALKSPENRTPKTEPRKSS